MITTLLVALMVALIQVGSHALTGRKLRELKRSAQIAQEHASHARVSAELASVDAASALALLQPAVARLPQTRSRKGKDPAPGPYSDMGDAKPIDPETATIKQGTWA